MINNLLAGSIYTHIKGAHKGLKYCNDCDYKATHRGTLTTHIKAVHKGLRIFVMIVNIKLQLDQASHNISKLFMRNLNCDFGRYKAT